LQLSDFPLAHKKARIAAGFFVRGEINYLILASL
jgi:hypothetical protein